LSPQNKNATLCKKQFSLMLSSFEIFFASMFPSWISLGSYPKLDVLFAKNFQQIILHESTQN
jgi:hypothetical protein